MFSFLTISVHYEITAIAFPTDLVDLDVKL